MPPAATLSSLGTRVHSCGRKVVMVEALPWAARSHSLVISRGVEMVLCQLFLRRRGSHPLPIISSQCRWKGSGHWRWLATPSGGRQTVSSSTTFPRSPSGMTRGMTPPGLVRPFIVLSHCSPYFALRPVPLSLPYPHHPVHAQPFLLSRDHPPPLPSPGPAHRTGSGQGLRARHERAVRL